MSDNVCMMCGKEYMWCCCEGFQAHDHEIERLRSSLEDSQRESERLTAELEQYQRKALDLKFDNIEKGGRIEELEEAFRPVLDAFCDTSWNETTGLHQGVVHVTTLNIARRALEETEVK